MILKLCLVGESGVGKSYLTYKFVHDTLPVTQITSTIGIDYGVHTIHLNNQHVRVQVWDTAGQERFKSITETYYKSSDCAVLIYDISDRDTFIKIEEWRERVGKINPVMYLIGNKRDLEHSRQVSYEEGQKYAESYGMNFQECSKYDDVINVFTKIAETVISKIDKKTIALVDDDNVPSSCCVIL
jgi:small GTP-binding protein